MKRIVLAGMKHCGKSTIGWKLSSELGLFFADLDDLILRDVTEFETIREIFTKLGSDTFKELERKSISRFLELNENKSFVLSLGGGTIENKKALDLLNGAVDTIYLDAEKEVLFNRIIKGGIPPFLDKTDPEKSFYNVYNKRTPIYKNWAKHIVDTKGLEPGQITDIIISNIL